VQKVTPVWTARRSIGRLLPATADDNGGGKSSQASLPKGYPFLKGSTRGVAAASAADRR